MTPDTPARAGASQHRRVATYTRHRADDGHARGLAAQQRGLRDYLAAQPGWRQVAAYHDTGSAADADRPGLAQALADADAGRFDVLLVTEPGRLTRRVATLVSLIDRLDQAGVTLHATTAGLDTSTPGRRRTVTLLATIACADVPTAPPATSPGHPHRGACRPGGPAPSPQPRRQQPEWEGTSVSASAAPPAIDPRGAESWGTVITPNGDGPYRALIHSDEHGAPVPLFPRESVEQMTKDMNPDDDIYGGVAWLLGEPDTALVYRDADDEDPVHVRPDKRGLYDLYAITWDWHRQP